MTGPAAVTLSGVEKAYGALRPLRIRELVVQAGEAVALTGLDGPAAEVLVDLITGSVLPDRGEVAVFGTSTAAVPDGEAWLSTLDQFGMLSRRAVLLEGMTTAQNLALPFSLELNPIPDAVRTEVMALAREVGLEDADLARPVAELDALGQWRVRLARAVALGPRLLLAEHPNALVEVSQAAAVAEGLARVAAGRSLSLLTVTADPAFAGASARRVLRVDPATGDVREGSWRDWFRRR